MWPSSATPSHVLLRGPNARGGHEVVVATKILPIENAGPIGRTECEVAFRLGAKQPVERANVDVRCIEAPLVDFDVLDLADETGVQAELMQPG